MLNKQDGNHSETLQITGISTLLQAVKVDYYSFKMSTQSSN